MEERIRRVKVRKLMGRDKDSLTDKAKSHMCKQSEIRNSLTASHRQAGVQPSPGKLSSITQNSDVGRQMPSL